MTRFYSLDDYCKQTFGEKVYKIALDANMTCPNRDGTLDTRGCIFCSSGGSGDFAIKGNSISKQLETGKEFLSTKHLGNYYIAYFQSYTNTYASCTYLEKIFREALDTDFIIGISIATRPDCLSFDVLTLLKTLKQSYPSKFIWIELGLQTIHERTAHYIRRGYSLSCFEQAVSSLQQLQIPIIVHLILGLPFETKEELLESISYLNQMPIWGVKLQLLHVLKGTDLCRDYENQLFCVLSFEEYIDILISCIELLSTDIVIHRLTGDGPKSLLVAPLWSLNKRKVLGTIQQELKRRDTWQGKHYHATRFPDSL